MQFDNFDNKVKQAAEQHHPSYDAKAWAKMEKLLDHHLPQNNDRRRGVIILLLFLVFLGGGVLIIMDRPWQKNKLAIESNNAVEQGKNTVSSPGTTANETPRETKAVDPAIQQQGTTGDPGIQNSILTNNDKSIAVATDNNNKSNPGKKTVASQKPLQDNGNSDIETFNGKVGSRKQPGDDLSSAQPGKDNQTIIPPVTGTGDAKNALPADKTGDKTDQPVNTSGDKAIVTRADPKNKKNAEQQQSVPGKKATPKAQSKKGNSLFVSVSVGPDYSAIGLNGAGKIKPVSGAGMGYTINGRWTIRTGFYTGSKVYTADKYEYKPAVPVPNPNLDRVDANCKVYEIPLTLAYTFNPSSKNQWFASTGLSSYIMKEEKYEYLYKYPNGTTYSYHKTIDNENKHYFSVLTLSGGYQRNINRIFSIAAEPYIKLPLTGIGFGNVKLNSAGVLFSLSANLFTSAAKK